jgi:hypothetical protein
VLFKGIFRFVRCRTWSMKRRIDFVDGGIRYVLSRWDALTHYIEDGHVEIDNNAAERSLRGVALGRNYAQSAIMCSL